MRFLHDKSWSDSSFPAGPSRPSLMMEPIASSSRSYSTGQAGLGPTPNPRRQWQQGNNGDRRSEGRRIHNPYPLVTLVGLSLATGAVLHYGISKAWRNSQRRTLLLRAEEALAEYVRPSQLAEVPTPPAPPAANTFFGSYRPPAPPPPAPLGLPRRGSPRPPNPGWGEGRVHAPIYPRPPAPRVVGMMAEERSEGEDQNHAAEERFEGQDIRELRTYFEGEFRAMKRRLDGVEGMLHQILEILRGGDRPLDPHERRPPHDNHGQQPRDDESDNSDDDDDDFHHPPGARIRRPVTPNAGPMPLPEHLEIARPGLAAIRPIVNIEPEETRGLGPETAAADPAAEHIFAVDQIGAVVRELQARYQNLGQPIPEQPIPEPPIPAPPTPATTFTNPDPTFDELKFTMESLDKHYPELTTNEVVDAIKEIAETRGGPARAALDGHRRPEDGEAPKPKGKSTKKKTEPREKPAPVATPSIDDIQSPGPSEIDDGSEPPSPASTDSSWTPVPDPDTILTGDAKIFNDALEEGMTNERAKKGKGKAVNNDKPATVKAPSDSWSEISESEQVHENEYPIPSGPGPSNWIGRSPPSASTPAGEAGLELEAEGNEVPMQRPRERRNSDDIKPSSDSESAVPHLQHPTLILIEEPARPIGPRAQLVRVHLYIPHEENLDDDRRRGHNGLLELEVEARGHAGVIEQVRISGVDWVVEESSGVYVLVEPLV